VREGQQSEIERICQLPFSHAALDGLAAFLTRVGASRELRPVQLAAIAEFVTMRGGVGPIGVGHGKTLIALLTGTALGAEHTIILTRPGAVAQLETDLIEARKDFHVRSVEIMSYDAISRQKLGEPEALKAAARGWPDDRLLIVADEAHALKDIGSNRTRRLTRFLTEHPAVMFVALSGTFYDRQMAQFSHLFDLALGSGSPYPRPRFQIEHARIAQCLDADGQPSHHDWAAVASMWRLYYPHLDMWSLSTSQRRSALREAWAHRLAWCPGVHVAAGTSCDASIEIKLLPLIPTELIASALTYVRNTGDNLDGIPLLDDAQRASCLLTITCGYFFRTVWPASTTDEQRKHWLSARGHYSKLLRSEIETESRYDYDSRGLIEQTMRIALETRGPESELEKAYVAWKEQEALIEPGSECVWLDFYMVDFVVSFVARHKQPWLVWYQGIPFGDQLGARGLRVYGANSNPETDPGHSSICLSIDAHTESINMQRFSRNLVLIPPGRGAKWEQLVGRTHRQGQHADVIEVRVLAGTTELDKLLDKARRDALYRQTSTGVPERLCFASWR